MDDLQILLIGGPPGAGKSTLGRALAAELGFGSLTADDLAIAGRMLTTPETHPALHVMRPVGYRQYFTDGPAEKLIADAIAVEETMWPVVERVISSHIESRAPIVIDWWLLSPKTVGQLEDKRIASIWLHIDADALEQRERSNTEYLARFADPERMLTNFMARSLWRNDLVAAQAAAARLPTLELTGRETVDEMVNAARALMATRHDAPG